MGRSSDSAALVERPLAGFRERPMAAQAAAVEADPPPLSVIVGFRDWGLERLELALRAHRASTWGDRLELIVVDFGSKNAAAIECVARRSSARVCRVDVRGRWNRSRCLNVGIRAAKAPRVLTTDADILFGPHTIETLLEAAEGASDFLLVQCHDLPPMEPRELESLDFDRFAQIAELRPPWGMGGCACFRRQLAVELRGFDERMEWWGSEDNDFVQRAMQHGENVRWLDHPDARCYHIWHPKATEVHAKNDRFQATVKRNRRLVAEDSTVVRNAFPWGVPIAKRPSITASIVTHNRARLLGETLESLLAQTWRDFELLVVDDGSEDGTEAVVNSYGDPRIRYLRQNYGGIPAARNLAVKEARGEYICTVDDDDIQMPDRIERHLAAVEDGYIGSYGGWIDFDEETGELSHQPGRPYSLEALLYTAKVLLHPATCILREVLLAHPYNPSIQFGSDFDLALRIAASGYRLKHVGAYSILRRLHSGAVTTVNGNSQRQCGVRALQRLNAALTAEEAVQARKRATQSKPLMLDDPLKDRSLLLRLPPSLSRLLSASSGDASQGPLPAAGRRRLLERTQQRPARLELGPFGSVKQCEVNMHRLTPLAGVQLAIEARQQGAVEQAYYIVWPWTTDGAAWEAADWIERTYRYPSQVVVKDDHASSSSAGGVPDNQVAVEGRCAATALRALEQVAAGLLPQDAQVLVVSRGDETLLRLGGACGAHFPQADDGQYAGFHPADSADAVARLVALKERGAEFLVIPASSFWWLEHYEGFRRYLDGKCRLIHFEDEVCLVYALNPQPGEASTGLSKPLSLVIGSRHRTNNSTGAWS